MFCTRLANGGLFPTGDPIVPFVISPWFECLNKLTHSHVHTGVTALPPDTFGGGGNSYKTKANLTMNASDGHADCDTEEVYR